MGAELKVISCFIPRESADPFLEVLDSELFTPTIWENVETGQTRLDVFLEDPNTVQPVLTALTDAASILELPLTPTISSLRDEDWQEAFKRFFHVMRVSRRLVVRPSWEDFSPEPDDRVITLDPGMSFGTGQHGTTQACLYFLDQIANDGPLNRSVLDIGCGSGILAIGAALLGFNPVNGFDNDPDAVKIALENAALNHVQISFTTGDLAETADAADIAVANILAPVLITYAAPVTRAAKSDLIISGILDEQYPAVLAAYQAQGFHEVQNRLINGWRSGWLKRTR